MSSNMLIYSILDLKGKLWSRPMFALNNGFMLRHFGDMANDKREPIGQHPEDYNLYQIGEWDDKEGKLIPLDAPISMGIAVSYVDDKVISNEKEKV